MSFLTPRRKAFQTVGKDKIQIIVDEITSYDEESYAIAAGPYTEGFEGVDAGYSTTIWGQAKSYHRNERRVKQELRLSVKINPSCTRLRADHGIIGGGVFESGEYVEIEINVEPWCVKDIVEELRRSRRRGIRIDGYAISDKVFRVSYFLLFPPKDVA